MAPDRHSAPAGSERPAPLSVVRLAPRWATPYRAFMLQAYAAHPDAFTSSASERAALPLAWWEERLSSAACARELVLAVRDGELLLGVAGLAFETREKTAHKCTLFGMYVHPAQRSAGIGHRLVLAALDAARARPGVQLVQLSVTAGNHGAEALYRRCGFIPFGREPQAVAVTSGFVDKVHMWCALAAQGGQATDHG